LPAGGKLPPTLDRPIVTHSASVGRGQYLAWNLELQLEVEQTGDLLEELRRRLKAQLASFPADVEDVSNEMIEWEECPTVDFFVHGLLRVMVSDLDELLQDLQEVAGATPESIRKRWLRFRSSRSRSGGC
jgi:hypothetical protein